MDLTGRHSRHHLFAPIGADGQARIERARIAVVGCGALGSRIAELLVRAGAGRSGGLVRIIDRDYVDLSNLQRQALFDEKDAASSMPKAAAALRHLKAIDGAASCEAHVRDLNPSNVRRLLGGIDLAIDGTDNFRTRFLINDAAVSMKMPWIYGAAVGSRGMVATIIPGTTPCLRCYLGELPPLGTVESCDTAGIITPLPALVASMQVTAALRYLVDGSIERGLFTVDLWPPSFGRIFARSEPDPQCLSCGTGELPALNGPAEELVTLCGRNSVQISDGADADLDSVAARLQRSLAAEDGSPALLRHPQSLTAEIPEGKLTVFADGRVVVEGTVDPLLARSIVSRYLGG
jgi:molybdopterin-synthase adenylyltransferase